MVENKYKVLITTSGIGQRLGDLTNYTNKSLVRVGKKPALSYIIESYSEDVSFVITVGYFGDQVRDFIKLAYPKRKVEFVEVDTYDGPGSSLGYSMLRAKDKLQCPFIYHACDTIITEKVSYPEENWIGGHQGSDTSQYASWKILNNQVLSFSDKGAIDFDYIHIGLVGVKDYQDYWRLLEELYKEDSANSALNDCRVIVKMLENKNHFKLIEFSWWFDIGNTAVLHHARKTIGDHFDNLDKVDESIFLFDDFVIKFFADEKIAKNRVERARILNGLVPKVDAATKNFYRYNYVGGNLYSRVVNPGDFRNFLEWSKNNLWKRNEEVNPDKFKKICFDFYHAKTKQRIDKFLKANRIEDKPHVINGEPVPSIKDVLKKIDFDWLATADQYNFHGDFILDNILKTADGYCLLDWRQDFGGLLKAGDMYYDLAKLNHNLTVNHDIINQNLFSIEINDDLVKCDILRKENLVACQKVLLEFLKKENYNYKKVKLLTALIWLNMSPLHHHPFNLFLFYFGKLNLWRAIQENQ